MTPAEFGSLRAGSVIRNTGSGSCYVVISGHCVTRDLVAARAIEVSNNLEWELVKDAGSAPPSTIPAYYGPCRSCGKRGSALPGSVNAGTASRRWEIRCDGCGLLVSHADREMAIAIWNNEVGKFAP